MNMEDIIKEMYLKKIITFGKYKLSSGRISPFYINLRTLPSYPDLFKKLMNKLVNYIETNSIEFEVVVGIETSGIVYATYLGCLMNKSIAYIRKKKKEHGLKNLVEGIVENKKVIIVDDVSTTGSTIYSAVLTIRENNGLVSNALVIIDRMEGAYEKLREINTELRSLLSIKTIIKTLVKHRLISSEEIREVINYYRELGYSEVINDDNYE